MYGGVHVILSMQGHHGALGARPPYPRDGTALLGHLRGATHTPCSTVGLNSAQRRSGVVRWRVRYPQQLGPQWGIALPNCTAKATHLRIAGHCLVTFGGHTHTSKTTFGVANTVFVMVRIAVWVSYGSVDTIFNHLLQLGPPWGLGAMPLCPRDDRTLLGHLGGGTQTTTTTTQPHSALPTPYFTVRVLYGGVHVILYIPGTPPTSQGDGRALSGHLRGPSS